MWFWKIKNLQIKKYILKFLFIDLTVTPHDIFKGIINPKSIIYLLTLMSFQTCMSFFLMLNIRNYAGNQRVMVPIDFHSISFPTMEVNGDYQQFVSSKSYFMFNIRNKLIQL